MLHPSHFLPLRSHPRRPTVSFSQKRIIPSKRHRRFSILILTRFNPTALRLRAQSGLKLKKKEKFVSNNFGKTLQSLVESGKFGKKRDGGRNRYSRFEFRRRILQHAYRTRVCTRTQLESRRPFVAKRGPRQKGGEGGLPWETVPFAAARKERNK